MFNRKKKRELKSGNIEKEISYMMAVPKNVEEIKDPKNIIDRLKEATLFDFKGAEMKENITIKVSYKGKDYELELIPEDFELSEMYTINHNLTEENYNAMLEAKVGVTTAMKFGESVVDSYHLQLKVLYTLLPDMVGIVDFCTEKILSSVWAKLAAESEIPPSPDYIYCVQAVSDEDGNVWLHTHGLNRCGSIEVEILQSTRDTYKNHYYILQTIAKRVISDGEFVDEEESFLIGYMNNRQPLVGTWVNWPIAVTLYKNNDIMGGIKDRIQSHKHNTGVVFIYLSESDCDEKKYTHISAVDDDISINALLMLTIEETERMSKLAKERIEYFKDGIENTEIEIHGLAKMGLLVDDEYQNKENNKKEHIWFEVLEINGQKIKGILTQEPYYIEGLTVNTEMELNLKDLTDWILYTPDGQITPDSVYLLEE